MNPLAKNRALPEKLYFLASAESFATPVPIPCQVSRLIQNKSRMKRLSTYGFPRLRIAKIGNPYYIYSGVIGTRSTRK
jgi:hypothetical protein